jgi:hypothetical protein
MTQSRLSSRRPSTPGQQPDDRINDHHDRQLAAGQHIIADAERVVHPLGDALVIALVTRAQDYQVLTGAGQPFGIGLFVDRAARRG